MRLHVFGCSCTTNQPNHLTEPRARGRRAGVHTLPEAALRPVYAAVHGAD